MRLWFDTEFIEDGKTVEMLSIGVAREDGETYYAEPAETDHSRADEWVQENVLPHLTGPVKPRAQIAAELIEFAGDKPEWWAYYADYDWVVLCQLYGRMIDLPDGWPMFCMDLKQWATQKGNPDLHKLATIDGPEHNALADARWAADAWAALDALPDADLEAAQDEIERLIGEKEALRERLEWEQHEPDDDVIGVDDHTAPDNEQDGYTWGRVHKAGEGGPHSEWKGYKNGGKVYLDWPELVRRWGPLTVSSRLSTCPPCSTGDHSNHRAELADCCIGCACDVQHAITEALGRGE